MANPTVKQILENWGSERAYSDVVTTRTISDKAVAKAIERDNRLVSLLVDCFRDNIDEKLKKRILEEIT
jgi:hypothetical protein